MHNQISIYIILKKIQYIVTSSLKYHNYLKLSDNIFLILPNRKTYNIVDTAKIVISLDSSLGYEALARKNVVCFFSLRPNKYPTNSSNFGWPQKKISARGPFWTNSENYNEVKRVLNNAQKINPDIFFNKPKIKKLINSQIIYDSNNKIFISLINNILKKA